MWIKLKNNDSEIGEAIEIVAITLAYVKLHFELLKLHKHSLVSELKHLNDAIVQKPNGKPM